MSYHDSSVVFLFRSYFNIYADLINPSFQGFYYHFPRCIYEVILGI